MTAPGDARDPTEDLLRELAPQVLGAVARRYGSFADAEDAVQEALAAAASTWPAEGQPDNPAGWLVRVASRRMVDQYRRDDARRRREDLAASWSIPRDEPPPAAPGEDDSLVLLFMCCHPALPPSSAIPLTLRAVGGLTTREIAAAFLVPEPTMAQRISRAKARLAASGEPFSLPPEAERADRLRSVLHVLYLLFNEGYAASAGPALQRNDLAAEAIRLTRALHARAPEAAVEGGGEIAGLLALMLLTDARRAARTGPDGELVPLSEQDRTQWDRASVDEGVALVERCFRSGPVGEYQLQAAVAGVHDLAARYEDTDWEEIAVLYQHLEALTGNPMVTLNRAVAVAMVDGPQAGLDLLATLDEPLGDHHRLAAVRAHLLEQAGDVDGAIAAFRAAAARSTNLPEQQYLTTQAARLAHRPRD